MNNFLKRRGPYAFPDDFLFLFCDKKQKLVNFKQHCDNFLDVWLSLRFSLSFLLVFSELQRKTKLRKVSSGPVANIDIY